MAAAFLDDLYKLRIDTGSVRAGEDRLFGVAREYGLSGYDAAYLDLAMSSGLPLATVDKDMRKAAVKAGVSLYLA